MINVIDLNPDLISCGFYQCPMIYLMQCVNELHKSITEIQTIF